MSEFTTAKKTIEYELSRQNKSVIREWYAFSLKGYTSPDECEDMMNAFCDVVERNKIESIEFPGAAYLSGKVYNHGRFPEGSDISTSHIVKLERVNIPEEFESLDDAERIMELLVDNECELLCATTATGSRYYLLKGQMSCKMRERIDKFLKDGTVDWHHLWRHNLR
ncbi:MAG: hypothetical protein MJ154_03010 [Candidatus Saccharibacteria bacterium]|nr:hypothetical protein [Candidatus Saccharibacteria bacterium]